MLNAGAASSLGVSASNRAASPAFKALRTHYDSVETDTPRAQSAALWAPAELDRVLHEERECPAAVAAPIDARLASVFTVSGEREQPSQEE